VPTALPVYHLTLPGPTFAIGTYRSFPARGGYGYAATLLHNGTPVADLSDDGTGAPARATWHTPSTRPAFLALAEVFPAGAGSLPAELCPAIKAARSPDAWPIEEWLIGEFATHEYLRRSLNRTARTATAVLLPGQAATQAWTKIKAPYSERVRRYLTSHYGTGQVLRWDITTGWQPV
jgi:hypothetical protein